MSARCWTTPAVAIQAPADLAAAEPLTRATLEMRKRLFPGDNPDVARSTVHLAILLQGRNDLAGSEALLREALRMFRSMKPESETSIATVEVDLGQVLSLEKRFS